MLRLKTIDFKEAENKDEFDREVAEFMANHDVINYVLHEPYIMTIYFNTKERILTDIIFKRKRFFNMPANYYDFEFKKEIDRKCAKRDVQMIKFFPENEFEQQHAVIYYKV